MADGSLELEEEEKLKALYRFMRTIENKLGGGEGFEGIYGSLTQKGMQEIIQSLERNCDMNKDSAFVDIGSGLGRPLLHASLSPGLSKLWGIEMDSVKVQKSLTFLRQVKQSMVSIGKWPAHQADAPKITHCSIENIESLDSYTHGYAFWEGVPIQGKQAFGNLFTASTSMRGVAIVQRAFRKAPESEMAKLGFHDITLMQSLKVRMAGSYQNFCAYIFRRNKIPRTPSITRAFPMTPEKELNPRRHSEQIHSMGDMSAVRKSLGSIALTESAPAKQSYLTN